MSAAAAAASTLTTLTPSVGVCALPTNRELTLHSNASEEGVIALLQHRRLLLPRDRSCPRCGVDVPLHCVDDNTCTDGVRYRCNRCKNDYSLRYGSVFYKRKQSLSDLARLLSCIEQRVSITAAAKLAGVHYDTAASLYRTVRERIYAYMHFNPVMFADDDVIEIDECHLRMLNPDAPQQVWVIGMIARESGRVALELSNGHSKEEMRRVIMPHLPFESTTTISDRHKSFNFLEETREHRWAIKQKTKHGLWVKVDEVNIYQRFEDKWAETPCLVHSNTIEGFWAHFRRELRGVQMNTLHLYLAEVMFRRSSISLAHTLTV